MAVAQRLGVPPVWLGRLPAVLMYAVGVLNIYHKDMTYNMHHGMMGGCGQWWCTARLGVPLE
jgi:hypothetical protein